MKFRSTQDRDIDDIKSPMDHRLASRFYAFFMHPDSPVPMFDFDAKRLSRHCAILYTGNHGRKPQYRAPQARGSTKGVARIGKRNPKAWG